jgi:uncharacterized protein (UPF0276 family)
MTTVPIELASSMCPALVELIQEGDAPIDRIEIGPWFTVDAIHDLHRQLPDWKFHLHDGDLHNGYGSLQPIIEQMEAQHAVTDSPFVSLHITLMFQGMVRIRKFGVPFPRLSHKMMTQRLIRRIEYMKQGFDKSIILENMPGFPKFTVEADPRLITSICEATDCDLLFDLGHARCAADNLNMDIYAYLSALPLHRIQQIHAHSPRVGRWNKLEDMHEPMQTIDYELLRWVLERCRPRIVTLEYWKDRSAIRDQLHQLREIIDSID